MSCSFRYRPFVAVFGILGEKVPVNDNVLPFIEQETYPTTSVEKNWRVWMSNGSELVCWFETNILDFETAICQVSWVWNSEYPGSKKKEHKDEATVDEERAAGEKEHEVLVLLVTIVNNILNSIFSNFEVYINNLQYWSPKGLYVHRSYFFNNFWRPSLSTG